MDKILQKEISKCDTCILYKPQKNEIDFNDPTFPINIKQNKFYLPNDKDSNPFELATKFSEELSGKKVYLLIPGTKFDIYGTRHGHGGGWYDKFLSKIPRSWIRIGVIEIPNFSTNRIKKNEWDEIMDLMLVRKEKSFELFKCLRNPR